MEKIEVILVIVFGYLVFFSSPIENKDSYILYSKGNVNATAYSIYVNKEGIYKLSLNRTITCELINFVIKDNNVEVISTQQFWILFRINSHHNEYSLFRIQEYITFYYTKI